MNCEIEQRGAFIVLRLRSPRLDSVASPGLKSICADLANSGQSRVVMDLAQVEFVDSSGLGALISAHKLFGIEGRLALCGVLPRVRSVLDMTQLSRLMTLAVSAEEAGAMVVNEG